MNFFSFDLKKWLLLFFVITLPLLSINIEPNREKSNSWFTNPISYLSSLTQDLFHEFSAGVIDTTQLYLNLINIKKENETIKEANNLILAQLSRFNELELENQRLRRLVDFKGQTKMVLSAAKIIGRDLVTDHRTVTINKGTKHGLHSGMAVITVTGVLGYVFKPDSYTSHVMLITDRYSVVDAVIQRSRAHGIVEGRNHQTNLQLQYVDRTEDVRPGDMVVTGGLDNIFPKGFPIAVVDTVERKTKSVSLKIDLKPIVDANSVEEVYVVLDASNEIMPTMAADDDSTSDSSNGSTPESAPVNSKKKEN